MTPPSSSGRALVADDEFESAEELTDSRSRMSFLEHLDELRRRILYSLYAVIACGLVTFFYWERLFDFYVSYFAAPDGRPAGMLMFSQPMAGFMFSLKVAALAAVVLAAPFIFSQVWLFVAPGLYAREKRVVLPFVFFSSVLFFGGAYFAHMLGYPYMWRFFAEYQRPGLMEFRPQLDMAFGLYVKVLLGMGLAFQMPVLIFWLARFGIVSARFLIRKFKYAVLIIVIAAAIITPSGDPMTLMVFSAPMILLYVVSIGVAWLFGRKRDPLEEAES
jgi:sec-independent protein translocase protein TatC